MRKLTPGENLSELMTFRVSPALKHKVERLAETNNITKQEVLRQLIYNYWEEWGEEEPEDA